MVNLAVLFLVIAVVAAIFGFGGIAGLTADIGILLLVVFLILAVASFLFGRRGVV